MWTRLAKNLAIPQKNPIEIGFKKYIDWYRDLYRESGLVESVEGES